MNLFELKNKIDENNKQIENYLTPNVFTLNNLVAELLKENESLQKQCTHEFENGYCKYCYKMQDRGNE